MTDESIRIWINRLDEEDANKRFWIEQTLLGIGSEARPFLLNALENEIWRIRLGALIVLTGGSPVSGDLLPFLRRLLNDEKLIIRYIASYELAMAGSQEDREASIPILCEYIRNTEPLLPDDPYDGDIGEAVYAMEEIGLGGALALIDLVTDSTLGKIKRQQVCEGLRNILYKYDGPERNTLISRLVDLLNEEDAVTKELAREVLSASGNGV